METLPTLSHNAHHLDLLQCLLVLRVVVGFHLSKLLAHYSCLPSLQSVLHFSLEV